MTNSNAARALLTVTAISGTLYCGAVSADQTAMRAALEAAWSRSVAATLAVGEVGLASELHAAAHAWWAEPPSLELEYRDGDWGNAAGAYEAEAAIAWPVILPSQRQRKLRWTDASLRSKQAAEQVERWQLAGRLRDLAWELWLNERQAEWAEQGAAIQCSLAEDVEKRHAAGELATLRSLSAKVDCTDAKANAATLRQTLNKSRMDWRLITGSRAPAEPTEPPATDSPDDWLDQHPKWRQISLELESAQLHSAVVSGDRRDPPEVLFRVRQEAEGAFQDDDRSLGFALRIPLATRDRNRPRIAQTEAELTATQVLAARVREQLEAELEFAAERERQSALLFHLEQERTALIQQQLHLTENAYNEGESSYELMLSARRAVIAAQLRLSEREYDAGLAISQLNHALGILP